MNIFGGFSAFDIFVKTSSDSKYLKFDLKGCLYRIGTLFYSVSLNFSGLFQVL